MGEAKRRRAAGTDAVPTALFVRWDDDDIAEQLEGVPEKYRRHLTVVGMLHMLEWPSDEDAAMRLVSRCADSLTDSPDQIPPGEAV